MGSSPLSTRCLVLNFIIVTFAVSYFLTRDCDARSIDRYYLDEVYNVSYILVFTCQLIFYIKLINQIICYSPPMIRVQNT